MKYPGAHLVHFQSMNSNTFTSSPEESFSQHMRKELSYKYIMNLFGFRWKGNHCFLYTNQLFTGDLSGSFSCFSLLTTAVCITVTYFPKITLSFIFITLQAVISLVQDALKVKQRFTRDRGIMLVNNLVAFFIIY